MVEFDIVAFRKRYPWLADVPDEVLEDYFLVAQFFVDNTRGSKITNLDLRRILLYLMVCHLATLYLRGDTTPGVLQSATQGKVSATFKTYDNITWLNETPCGAQFEWMIQRFILGGHYFAYRCC